MERGDRGTHEVCTAVRRDVSEGLYVLRDCLVLARYIIRITVPYPVPMHGKLSSPPRSAPRASPPNARHTHMPQGVVPRGGDARRARGVVVEERRADDDVRGREREHIRDRLQERRAPVFRVEERRRDQPRAERDLRAHALSMRLASVEYGE